MIINIDFITLTAKGTYRLCALFYFYLILTIIK